MSYEKKRRNRRIVWVAVIILILISIGFFMTNQFMTGNSVLDFLLKK